MLLLILALVAAADEEPARFKKGPVLRLPFASADDVKKAGGKLVKAKVGKEGLELDGDGFEMETLMNIRAMRAGLKIAEVPSYESDRVYGISNLSAIRDGWRVLKTILRERFSAPEDTFGTSRFPSAIQIGTKQ